jgi:hypothetical protein
MSKTGDGSPLALLKGAREALVNKGWCQRATARDCNGDVVYPLAHTATAFCAIGAIHHAGGRGFDQYSKNAILSRRFLWKAIAERAPGKVIEDYNDEPGRTKEEVIAVFDAAIQLAEAAPQ